MGVDSAPETLCVLNTPHGYQGLCPWG